MKRVHDLTLIPGDGIGPEITAATTQVLEAALGDEATINWDRQELSEDLIDPDSGVPERVLESIRKTNVALKAPITTPVGFGARSVNVALRRAFDLYACV